MNKIREKIFIRLKEDKKLLFIVIAGLSGMLLLLFSSGSGNEKGDSVSQGVSIVEIQRETEKSLTQLLETVEGAGRVKVMITFESAEEYIYAVNTEIESKADSYERKDEYVIAEDSGKSGGMTLKVLAPVVRGVGITCQGASSAVVRQEISRLVSAALGISANKIWVTVMEE